MTVSLARTRIILGVVSSVFKFSVFNFAEFDIVFYPIEIEIISTVSPLRFM